MLQVFISDPDWIQTNDLLLRRQLLYPTELPDQYFTNDLPDQNERPQKYNVFFLVCSQRCIPNGCKNRTQLERSFKK